MATSRDEQRHGLREEVDRTREEADRLDCVALDPKEHSGERAGARRRAGRLRTRVRDLQGRIAHLDRVDSWN